MFYPIRYLRGYVYPRGRPPFLGSPQEIVLGVAAVLLAVLALAYAFTVLAGL
jgi:hypothetical protein